MGSFQAGYWIIGVIIYYVLLFTIVGSAAQLNTQYGNTDSSTHYSEIEYYNNLGKGLDYGQCKGKSGAYFTMNDKIYCYKLLGVDINESCTNVSGCEWKSGFFGLFEEYCQGYVNVTVYGINDSSPETVCASSFLQTKPKCDMFLCDWENASEYLTASGSTPSVGFFRQMWQILTFNLDFDIGAYRYLLVFIFSFLPFIIFLWGIYMSIPLIHGG